MRSLFQFDPLKPLLKSETCARFAACKDFTRGTALVEKRH
jgi:hypothetical protein